MAAKRITSVGDELSSEGSDVVSILTQVPNVVGDTMRVTVSRSFKINLGDFQNMDSQVGISFDVPVDADMDEVSERTATMIDALQEPDMNLAHMVTGKRNLITRAMFGELDN